MKVIKRDGRVVEFDITRISNAVGMAMKEVGCYKDKTVNDIALQVMGCMSNKQMWKVDEIQQLVECTLMDCNMFDVARAYIIYRNKRDISRNSTSNQIIQDIIATKSTEVTRENANMNADTPAGMMMKIASERSKEFVDDFLLSTESKMWKNNNLLHIHDLDYYPSKSLTCLQHPIDKILKNGFVAGHGESRPAKRIETASILGCISMEQIQNEMHGGQSIPAFDFYLAPYVRSTYVEEIEKIEKFLGDNLDDLKTADIDDYLYVELDHSGIEIDKQHIKQHAINNTINRVYQSMEAFIHNMNTIHSRGGNQVVFSSINYGTDTSAEGRCVVRELLKSTYKGVGNGATAIFPIQVMKIKQGVNKSPNDRNYDLFEFACEVTAKRFFPNFINLDATFNKSELWNQEDPKRYEHEVATMGCRTRVFENRFGKSTSVGRGNLSFSTINLPGLALMSVKECSENGIEKFFDELRKLIDVTGKQLYDRYRFQCTAMAKQFPLLMSGMWVGSDALKPEDSVEPVLKHGTLGVGFIGLAECLIALTGKHHGESQQSQELGIKIVTFMRDEVKKLSEKYNLNFSLLATPAEGLSGKFTKKDRNKYGVIAGITDKDYYTNSNHVPVYYKCSASHKAKTEAPYHDLTRGGHIFYVELDSDATHNIQAIKDIVKLVDKHNIGYCSINHNRNRCMDCGYEDASENLTKCPKCGSDKIDTLQRITGYLVGTTSRWNAGKLAELKDRVSHE